jgi:outer membrane protein assembly factor BamB
MLGSGQNVIAFSGGGFSGRASSNSEQYESRVLVNYDVNKKAVAWRTQGVYLTHPALGNGVIYAASSTQLDAISELDGKVQWSWPLPAGDTGFHRNVVVTDNLIFVSTDTAVHAIDLKTRQSVWKYPAPGNVAISGGGILYISTGARESNGKLVAVKLM